VVGVAAGDIQPLLAAHFLPIHSHIQVRPNEEQLKSLLDVGFADPDHVGVTHQHFRCRPEFSIENLSMSSTGFTGYLPVQQAVQ
jgi:hypothetical protein